MQFDKGQRAEQTACQFLQTQGLQFIAQNFTGPQGEIDLIMKDKEYYVFVEVRYRHDESFAEIIESISPAKLHRIRRTAEYYLLQQHLLDKVDCRFDIICSSFDCDIDWIINAFEVQY